MADTAKADYHTRPNANVRVDAGNLAWARAEAKRRGQPFGDFMDGLITAERDRMAAPPAPVAARKEQPKAKGKREPEDAATIAGYYRGRNGGQ